MGLVWDRMHPKAKSDASASTVMGRSGWKCCRIGADVKASWSCQNAASAAGDHVKRTPLRVREVRGDVREL